MSETFQPIVAGIDTSVAGALAGAIAWGLAERARVPCTLIHAAREVVLPPGGLPILTEPAVVQEAVIRDARDRALESLSGHVPEACLESLVIRVGSAPQVLVAEAKEQGAGLIVVGGKKHRALGRWFGGSTAHRTVRLSPIPTLVVTESAAQIERILVAVDLSDAASLAIAKAERYARLLDARLRVMHSIEDLPFALSYPGIVDPAALQKRVEEVLEQSIWPAITFPDVDRIVRHGPARGRIEAEVVTWGAHLLVVGSHGREWANRLILGSVTEELLGALPASLLVVPTSRD